MTKKQLYKQTYETVCKFFILGVMSDSWFMYTNSLIRLRFRTFSMQIIEMCHIDNSIKKYKLYALHVYKNVTGSGKQSLNSVPSRGISGPVDTSNTGIDLH